MLLVYMSTNYGPQPPNTTCNMFLLYHCNLLSIELYPQTLELDLSSSPVASLVSVTNAEGSLVRMRPPSSVYVYSPDAAWSEVDGIR